MRKIELTQFQLKKNGFEVKIFQLLSAPNRPLSLIAVNLDSLIWQARMAGHEDIQVCRVTILFSFQFYKSVFIATIFTKTNVLLIT
jgi:hypothetical protein